MTPVLAAILVLTAALAAANGANDDAKGVATLAGAGVSSYRLAVAWGVVATLAGSALSLVVASRISTLFTKGIVSVPPRPAFGLAVLTGAAAWVALATVRRLPVSTTHAIAGALIGAGLLLAPGAINWPALALKVALPLLGSAVLAYAVAALLGRVGRGAPRCICVDVSAAETVVARSALPGGAVAATLVDPATMPLPAVTVVTSHDTSCPAHALRGGRVRLTLDAAHWLTAGATSFARGLNDTPKILVLGAFALVPGVLSQGTLLAAVALAMALGGAAAGVRVARRLGNDVVRMNHREGFMANLTTAALVGVGANLGLPMSTTHVSTGAISGVAGRDVGRLNRRTLREFALAWTLTPLVAGSVALAVFAVAR